MVFSKSIILRLHRTISLAEFMIVSSSIAPFPKFVFVYFSSAIQHICKSLFFGSISIENFQSLNRCYFELFKTTHNRCNICFKKSSSVLLQISTIPFLCKSSIIFLLSVSRAISSIFFIFSFAIFHISLSFYNIFF